MNMCIAFFIYGIQAKSATHHEIHVFTNVYLLQYILPLAIKTWLKTLSDPLLTTEFPELKESKFSKILQVLFT